MLRPDGPPPTVVLKGHTADLAGADFSPDGTRVVTASSDHSARIWDVYTGAVPATLGGHDRRRAQCLVQPRRHLGRHRGARGSAKYSGRRQRQRIKTLSGHGETLKYAASSSDGNDIVTASRDEKLDRPGRQSQATPSLTLLVTRARDARRLQR